MADILKCERHLRLPALCPQQVIVVALQFTVCEVIPAEKAARQHCSLEPACCYSRASVSVQQCGRLDKLLPISATFALERLMRFADSPFLELEELPESVNREVTLRILLLVNNAGRQCLFSGLTLEDFLLDRPRGNETINEA